MRTIRVDHLICLSDLHLVDHSVSVPFACEDALLGLLLEIDEGPETTLLLLGDVFDLWEMHGSPQEKIARVVGAYPRIFAALEHIAKRHHVLLLPGNHDRELTHSAHAREILRGLGIDVVEDPALMFELHGGDDRIVHILAEHGHQADPYNCYEHDPHPAERPFAEWLSHLFILPMKRMRMGDQDTWLRDVDNVNPLAALPWWMASKFFYLESGFWVKVLALPMILIFTLTKVGIVLAILSTLGWRITDAEMFSPRVYNLLLGFYAVDVFVAFLLVVVWLVRRDIYCTLRRWGVENFEVILGQRRRASEARANARLEETGADMYLFGHTHNELLRRTENGKVWCNTGTWVKRILRIRAWIYLPAVFIPVYHLTYARIRQGRHGVQAELRVRGQTCDDGLNYLERLAIFRRKRPVVYTEPDTQIAELFV